MLGRQQVQGMMTKRLAEDGMAAVARKFGLPSISVSSEMKPSVGK